MNINQDSATHLLNITPVSKFIYNKFISRYEIRHWPVFFGAILLLLIMNIRVSVAQENTIDSTESNKQKVGLYLDCNHCDKSYIKNKITFVNYVRDMNDADVHLLITTARTGSGGREYTLKFIGKKKFTGMSDTLKYNSYQTDTRDQERKGLVHRIKLGLVPYITLTTESRGLTIGYEGGEGSGQKQKYPWNHWVFEIEAGTHLNGEKTRKEFSGNASLSAERITHKWKLRFYFDSEYNWSKYEFSDGTTKRVHRNNENYNGMIARSLSPHWSLGAYSNARSSTYDNIDFSVGISPAIEYNVFPYSEYTRHELTFRYNITPYYADYTHETIYLKNSQRILKQQLSAHFDLTQPWGEIESRVEGSNFLNDFSKNRVDFRASVEIQIFRGLSLDLYGHYSLINNQVSLPKQSATDEEVLLNLRQQATSYSYWASIGLSYTFGSIYDNIVNTRL